MPGETKKKRPYKYSKKKPIPIPSWREDDVLSDVEEKLRNGQLADPTKIRGHVLRDQVTMTPTDAKGGTRSWLQKVAEQYGVPSEPPILPEWLREFAFRYAIEQRRDKDWARIFHVAPGTVSAWKARKDVGLYVLCLREERRALIAERACYMEDQVFRKYQEILSLPVNDDNVDAVRKTLLDLTQTMSGLNPETRGRKSGVMVRVNSQKTEQGQESTEVEVALLQQQIAEMEEIEATFEELDISV